MENDVMQRLKPIIEKHTVRYQVWPHHEMHDGKQVIVGLISNYTGRMITVAPVLLRDAASVPRPLPISSR
jgi:hypothetical protein